MKDLRGIINDITNEIPMSEIFVNEHHLAHIISVDYFEGKGGILVRIKIIPKNRGVVSLLFWKLTNYAFVLVIND